MSRWLEGRIAVVTGAARGIGRATAELFAHEGTRVLMNDVDKELLAEAADQIGKGGGAAHCFAGDVAAPGFAEDLLETSFGIYGIPELVDGNDVSELLVRQLIPGGATHNAGQSTE